MEVAIEFNQVTKRYSMQWHRAGGIKNVILRPRASFRQASLRNGPVLANVSLRVRAGEAVGIVGPNGAGKSTMLGLIAGVIRPTTGAVRVHGRVAPLLELGAGFHPELSGLDNIVLNSVLLGLTRSQARDRVDAILCSDQPIAV